MICSHQNYCRVARAMPVSRLNFLYTLVSLSAIPTTWLYLTNFRNAGGGHP